MPAAALGRSHEISVRGRQFPVDIARHPRARRYVLRVSRPGGCVSPCPAARRLPAALRFAERQGDWIEREWRRVEARTADWTDGTVVWYRGERVALEVAGGVVRAGGDVTLPRRAAACGQLVERHLRGVASENSPPARAVCARRPASA